MMTVSDSFLVVLPLLVFNVILLVGFGIQHFLDVRN
jgi:hypothetical protein